MMRGRDRTYTLASVNRSSNI